MSATDAFGDFRFPQIAVVTGGRVSGGAAAVEGMLMDLIVGITATQQFKLAVDPKTIVDRRGNRALIEEGSQSFEASDPTKVTLEPHPSDPSNRYATLVKAAGPLTKDPETGEERPVKIDFAADVDLGEGVKRRVLRSAHVIISSGEAQSVELSATDVEEQPDLGGGAASQ